MKSQKTTNLKILEQAKVIPVIRETTYKEGMKKTLQSIEGGFKIIEVTFTIPSAGKIIQSLKSKYPHITFIAGSVDNLIKLEEARLVGVKIIVAPNFNEKISAKCLKNDLIYIPGALTPTEIFKIIEAGWIWIKIFPGSIINLTYPQSIKSLYPNIKIMITGGVDEKNYLKWLSHSADIVGIGSSLFKGEDFEIKQKMKGIINTLYEN